MTARRFDEWGHHPATFSFPALERAVDSAVADSSTGRIADPFAGSGKAATFVTARGDRFVGIEAHPLTAKLAQVKLARPGRAEELRMTATRLRIVAARLSHSVRLADEQAVVRKFLPDEALVDLVAYRDSIEEDDPWAEHLRWAVIGAVRDVAGRRWPYASPRREPRRRSSTVAELVSRRLADMADDLAVAPQRPAAEVRRGDARSAEAWASIPVGDVSACVSSPPYLNGISYAEATRLELHFLGWARSWGEMRQASVQLVASCPQDVTKRRAREAADALAERPAISLAVTSLISRLERAQLQRTRPKRYDLLVVSYFADMISVLENLHRVMAAGARAAWVVGDSAPYDIYIDTPALLGLAATEVGFEMLDDVHLRDRGGRWPTSRNGHTRSLSERLLIFRRPAAPLQEALPGMGHWMPT